LNTEKIIKKRKKEMGNNFAISLQTDKLTYFNNDTVQGTLSINKELPYDCKLYIQLVRVDRTEVLFQLGEVCLKNDEMKYILHEKTCMNGNNTFTIKLDNVVPSIKCKKYNIQYLLKAIVVKDEKEIYSSCNEINIQKEHFSSIVVKDNLTFINDVKLFFSNDIVGQIKTNITFSLITKSSFYLTISIGELNNKCVSKDVSIMIRQLTKFRNVLDSEIQNVLYKNEKLVNNTCEIFCELNKEKETLPTISTQLIDITHIMEITVHNILAYKSFKIQFPIKIYC
jgi:hypothetical protein